MSDGHRVSRAVHYPQVFSSGVFDETALLQFRADDADKDDPERTYRMSVVCRCMMPADEAVHAYGTKIEDKQNQRLQTDLGTPPPLEKRRAYLGFYDILYPDLASVAFQYYRVGIRSVPEDGEDAHLEIQLHSLRLEAKDKQRRSDRSAALKTLAQRLVGPSLRPNVTEEHIVGRQAQLPLLPA